MSEHEHEHDHLDESEVDDLLDIESQSQIFLSLREQNVELLKIAAQAAGFGSPGAALKSGDVKNALRTIWEVYSEFYSWVDPEQVDEDEGEDDDEG